MPQSVDALLGPAFRPLGFTALFLFPRKCRLRFLQLLQQRFLTLFHLLQRGGMPLFSSDALLARFIQQCHEPGFSRLVALLFLIQPRLVLGIALGQRLLVRLGLLLIILLQLIELLQGTVQSLLNLASALLPLLAFTFDPRQGSATRLQPLFRPGKMGRERRFTLLGILGLAPRFLSSSLRSLDLAVSLLAVLGESLARGLTRTLPKAFGQTQHRFGHNLRYRQIGFHLTPRTPITQMITDSSEAAGPQHFTNFLHTGGFAPCHQDVNCPPNVVVLNTDACHMNLHE